MKKESFFNIKLLLFFIVLVLVLTYPCVRFLRTKLIGGGGDAYQYIGFETLVAQQIKDGKIWPFQQTDRWRYPDGFDFSRGYDSILSNLYGGILVLLTNNYILSYNLTILSSLLFNILCGYWFFGKLTKDKYVKLIAASSWGLCFYVLARAMGHANLTLIGGFALLAGSIFDLFKKQNWRHYLQLVLAVLILGLSSAQYLVLALIGLLVVLVVSCLFYPKKIRNFYIQLRQNSKKAIVSSLLMFLFLLPVFLPIASSLIQNDFVWRTMEDYSPSIWDVITPNKFIRVLGVNLNPKEWSQRNVEHVVFLGFIEIVLFLFLLIKNYRKKVVIWLGSLILTFLLFMLGTKNPDTGVLLPYWYLIKIYPFKAVSEPGRFVIIVSLLMMTLIVIGLNRINNKKIKYIILILILIERLSIWGGYEMEEVQNNDYIEIVRKESGKGVLDIPLYDSRNNLGAWLYDKKIIAGYIHWMGDDSKSRQFWNNSGEITRYMCDDSWFVGNTMADKETLLLNKQKNSEMIDILRKNKINLIIVNKDYQMYWPDSKCRNVLAQVTRLYPTYIIALESDLRGKEEQIKWAESKIDTGLYFPFKGRVKIVKIHLYPVGEKNNIKLSMNGKLINLDEWNYLNEDKAVWMSPMNKDIYEEVEAGTMFKISGNEFSKDGFMTIWYYYELDKNSEEKPLVRDGLVKIFEDENKQVLKIL